MHSMTQQEIVTLADTCVKCGLCLPRCPTYQKTAQEADSPRGRLALVQGFLTGTIPDTERLATSIDRCLECHACEIACPAGTKITPIIDAVRAVRMNNRSAFTRWTRKQLLNLAIHPSWFIPLVRKYQNTWLQRWISNSKLLQFLNLEHIHALLPVRPLIAVTAGTFYPTIPTDNLKTIALFPGCIGRFIDASAIAAACTILTRFGYQVTVPAQHCCCGALHRHDGFAKSAARELTNSAQLFSQYDKVLTVASACLESLRLHPELAKKTDDATRFIANLTWPVNLSLNTQSQTVWIHVPCSQHRPIGDPTAAAVLLSRIPGITVIPLPHNDICCGAAGTYMLRQPTLSRALFADKLQIIETAAATTIVTTNTGCALKFASELRNTNIMVCHPLEILANRLN